VPARLDRCPLHHQCETFRVVRSGSRLQWGDLGRPDAAVTLSAGDREAGCEHRISLKWACCPNPLGIDG
jgi:hypothetical protein